MKTKIFIKFILFIAPKLVIIYLSTLTLTLIHATLNSLLPSLIHDIIQQPLQLYYIGLTVTVTLTRHYSAATSTLLHWTPCYLHSYTILFSSHFNFATLNSLLPSLIHNIIQRPLQLCYIELPVTFTHTQYYSAATSTLLHWTHCYPHSYTTLFSSHFNFATLNSLLPSLIHDIIQQSLQLQLWKLSLWQPIWATISRQMTNCLNLWEMLLITWI
jgi:hypothetical protein